MLAKNRRFLDFLGQYLTKILEHFLHDELSFSHIQNQEAVLYLFLSGMETSR